MLSYEYHDNLSTAPIPAVRQTPDCGTSADVELMRRADATRAAYYANDYRKSVNAWGRVKS